MRTRIGNWFIDEKKFDHPNGQTESIFLIGEIHSVNGVEMFHVSNRGGFKSFAEAKECIVQHDGT